MTVHVDRDTITVELGSGVQLSPDGEVEVLGFIQNYVAWVHQAPLDPVPLAPDALIRFPVEPEHRKAVASKLRSILARPGMTEPAPVEV